MKLATFEIVGTRKIGAVTGDGDKLVDFTAASGGDPRFASMLALIEAGDGALETARLFLAEAERSGDHLIPLADVTLLAPIPVPPQFRDFSVFPAHIVQAPVGMKKLVAALEGKPIPDVEPGDVPAVYRNQPIYYITNRFSVVGPETTVRWPRYSSYMDHEIELAMVLSKGGKDIPVERAGEHIFGYTIFNDFSARDAQIVEMGGMLGPAKGKSFDAGNALGPFLVTKDEIPDVKTLKASVRINGESVMSDDCSAMLHSFEEMIAFVSRDETLHAGEVFGSGTVNNGCGLEHFTFLSDGDVVELEFDRIGVLRNTVVRQDG
ncbi:fumarylacetoacetate hydrolase family protein [Amorphus orientalis]|uniref:2-keto-4-pentenoate hydratase/2-oxohepta-3-ene-1,7-dioic acid hydratase in catechol pathway n=1 Tax=Amorphus orientalis TaxID=649198 RepID=A0AAE3VM15_9HYPH|nr:fumarylacetoacetate hydrolase family protein [Amorphus orientalis]MDQ0314418.1 2-keto-4-pentenoate hydratase/2-oxohepta-3-ene-1,7-dioic acid hydratase in catechol pathway [Amorphus orientalis]